MKLKLSSRKPNLTLLFALLAVTLCLFAPDVMAQATDAQTKLCGVMATIYGILRVASVVIVTIAIIFSGYQIAFAHKRISDVAPILIGGVLIGAASQIAAMVIGNNAEVGNTTTQCAGNAGAGGTGGGTAYVITAKPGHRA